MDKYLPIWDRCLWILALTGKKKQKDQKQETINRCVTEYQSSWEHGHLARSWLDSVKRAASTRSNSIAINLGSSKSGQDDQCTGLKE